MRRKEFLRFLAASLLVPRLAPGTEDEHPGLFTDEQAKTIRSLLDTIWPGCLKSNAYPFLKRWLGIPGYGRHRAYFNSELRLLNVRSRKRYQRAFYDLDREKMLYLVDRLYEDEKQRRPFYNVLLQAALMSVFGDPAQGVNPGKKGWKMIGFSPGPQLHFPHLEY